MIRALRARQAAGDVLVFVLGFDPGTVAAMPFSAMDHWLERAVAVKKLKRA